MSDKIIKVIYFDEGSAVDYLDITNGGLKVLKTGEIKETTSNASASTGIAVKTGVLFKAIKPIIDISIKGSADGQIGRISESVIETTITNTLLADYLEIADNDKNIITLNGYTVTAYKNSLSFMKMYTPYLNMIKENNETIDFSKIDETFERSKGFYELLAINKSNDKKILRFNIKSFRNNYNLVDITKMSLSFYAIEVGQMKLTDLSTENEFDFQSKKEILSLDDLENPSAEELQFYDVVLAGIMGKAYE